MIAASNIPFYGGVNALGIVTIVAFALKAVALCVLAIVKDLGKKKTWIIFFVLLGLDVIGSVILMVDSSIGFLGYAIMGSVSLLISDGTLGLAIHGKYKDKQSRGSAV